MSISSFSGKYRFLSNFYVSPIVISWTDGKRISACSVPTVEHGYQAMKCVTEVDFRRVCEARTPGEAKRLGRRVQMRPTWDEIKDEMMLVLLRRKFEDAELARMLVETGDQELIEGNTWGDTYWGVCRGVGKNTLGKLLMTVREELRGV